MDWSALEVGEDDLARQHPTRAQLKAGGQDVCVLQDAFAGFELQREDAIGWRGEVTDVRGNPRVQIEVFGEWFSLDDDEHIAPIVQEGAL